MFEVHTYNAKSPKQGSKRLDFITKTILFARLVILVIFAPGPTNKSLKRAYQWGMSTVLLTYRLNQKKENNLFVKKVHFLFSITNCEQQYHLTVVTVLYNQGYIVQYVLCMCNVYILYIDSNVYYTVYVVIRGVKQADRFLCPAGDLSLTSLGNYLIHC